SVRASRAPAEPGAPRIRWHVAPGRALPDDLGCELCCAAGGQAQFVRLLGLGPEAGDALVMELDLSGYLDRVQDASAIQQALLTLETSVSFPRLPSDSTLTYANSLIFFKADDRFDQNGVELWKTDGSVLGTNLLKDINPGHFFAGPTLIAQGSNPQNLTNVNGRLFFTATDFTSANPTGTELWKSDGT